MTIRYHDDDNKVHHDDDKVQHVTYTNTTTTTTTTYTSECLRNGTKGHLLWSQAAARYKIQWKHSITFNTVVNVTKFGQKAICSNYGTNHGGNTL